MGIFKRKKSKNQIVIKNSWNEVTFDEFNQIAQISASNVDDNFKLLNIISILSSTKLDDIIKLPLETIRRLSKAINFLNKEMPKIKYKDHYIINGTKYDTAADLTRITTAQYIDYTNFMKEEVVDYCKVMAVFLIPHNHSYNDGYDFNKVVYDVSQLNILDFNAIAFFLSRQFAVYILIIADSLKKKMAPAMKTKSIEDLQILLRNTASLAWSCEFAKSRSHRSRM